MELDARAATLLGPFLERTTAALAKVGAVPSSVVMGEESNFFRIEGDRVVLSRDLTRQEGFHPREQVALLPPMEASKRAAVSVVEAASLMALSKHVGQPVQEDWAWCGWAVYQASSALRGWGVAAPEVAHAVTRGDLVAHPRSGVVVCLAWEQEGIDVARRVIDVIANGVRPSSEEWLRLGAWILDREEGPQATLPVFLPKMEPLTPPADLQPWSWRRVKVGVDVRGGEIRVTGRAAVREPWCRAGEEHETIVGHTDGEGRLTMGPGAPLGAWRMASAERQEQVMSARGVTLTFSATGRFAVHLENASLGPLAGLAVQASQGARGLVEGRWRVVGQRSLGFDEFDFTSLVMPDSHQDRFAQSVSGVPLWLQGMQQGPWGWMCRGDRLFLQGVLQGVPWEIRLRRAEPLS